MDLVAMGVVAGVLGTLAMDSLNLLFARTGMLSKIDVGMIGRMAVGWARGRFRYGHPSEIGTGREREALRLHHALHHRRGPRGPVCVRLGSLGRRACITGMGPCLWRRDDDSFLLLRFPFHGVGSVWQAVSRRHQGSSFQPGQPPILWSGSCGRGSTGVSTG